MTAEENGNGSTSADNGRRAERPSAAMNEAWGWSSQYHSFDNLAKGLADGTLSRRRALWLLGSAFVGGWLFLTSGRRGFAQDDFTSCAQRDPSNCPEGYACCPRGVLATKTKDKDKDKNKGGTEFVCTPPELIPLNGGCSCPPNQQLCTRGSGRPQCVDVTCPAGQFFNPRTCECEIGGAEGICEPQPCPPEGCCFLPCQDDSGNDIPGCQCVTTLEPDPDLPGEAIRVTRCVQGDRNTCQAPECETSADCNRPGQVCAALTDPGFGCCPRNVCVPLCGVGGLPVS